MRRFRGPEEGLEHKTTDTDPVSEADREAELIIAAGLREARPRDGLLAEEGASAEGDGGRRWLVDPLDGTVNFLYGHAAWCVSIGLEDPDGLAVGVVHDPARGETFTARRGGGAFLDGESIRVRRPARLGLALVGTGFGYEPARRERQARTLVEVVPRVRDIRRAGSAALDLAWVAAGRLDGYYEIGLQPWDWAAGRLLVGEAGGTVVELPDEAPGLVAASPELVDELLALVTPR